MDWMILTLAMAVTMLGERPSIRQWSGIAVVLGFFGALSIVGRQEGIRFGANQAVFVMVAATVQAWFSLYLVPVMLPMAW